MRAKLQKIPREPRPREPVPAGDPMPSGEALQQMIAEAAYYRAEKRGFAPGMENEDWREAEAEVLRRVRAMESRI